MFSFIKKIRDKRFFTALGKDISTILQGGSVTMLDAGAAGGILPRWEGLKGNISFIGVEPDQRSYEALMNASESKEFYSYQIIPKGAWSVESNIKINFTKKPLCSTFFTPNATFLKLFPDSERFEVVNTFEIECSPVDSLLSEGKNIDFVKLDLEGGEIEIINGATDLLSR